MITTENARELQQKAAQSRRLQKAQEVLHVATLTLETQALDFEQQTLARVRLQLHKLFEIFIAETKKSKPDPQALDRIVNAQARLAEQERVLAGRPRPMPARADVKQSRRNSHFIDLAPIPSASDTTSNSVPPEQPEAPRPEPAQPAIPQQDAPASDDV